MPALVALTTMVKCVLVQHTLEQGGVVSSGNPQLGDTQHFDTPGNTKLGELQIGYNAQQLHQHNAHTSLAAKTLLHKRESDLGRFSFTGHSHTHTHTHTFSSDRIILESKDFLSTTHSHTHVFIRPYYISVTNFYDNTQTAFCRLHCL